MSAIRTFSFRTHAQAVILALAITAFGLGPAQFAPAAAQDGAVNPFVGQLAGDQPLYYALVERLTALQDQLQQVNRRVLEAQSQAQQTARELEQVRTNTLTAAARGNLGGGRLLADLDALETAEEQTTILSRVVRGAEFVMCANGKALFRDIDGARYLVSLEDAESNETFRTLGACR